MNTQGLKLDSNLTFIRDEYHYLGIGEFPEKEIADKIGQDAGKFLCSGEIPYSQYGREATLIYELHFKKNERPAMYLPYQYQATLKEDAQKTKRFRVGDDVALTMREAFNLLNGRAVHKLIVNQISQKMQSAWLQLDFGAKDVHGNVKLRQLPLSHNDYGVSASLDKYPILEMKYPQARTRVIFSLLKGNVEPITLLTEGREQKAFVEASPVNKGVKISMVANAQRQERAVKGREAVDKNLLQQPERQQQKSRRKGKSL